APPAPLGSSASQFTQVGNLVFFTADDGVHGQELWVSDGTAAHTHLVKDIDPRNAGPLSLPEAPTQLTAFRGKLYFLVKDVNRGPILIGIPGPPPGFAPGSSPAWLTDVKGTLYFTADGGTGVGLWRSDGSDAGTRPVAGLSPGSIFLSNNPANLTSVN